MRHLLSVLLAVILAPIIYVTAGYAEVKWLEAHQLGNVRFVPAILCLTGALVAGALFAVLVMARISPLGPLLAGLAFFGITMWALFDAASLVRAFPTKFLGVNGLLFAPVGALTLVAAVPLIATVFSPRRWRRQAAAPVYQGATTYSPPYSADDVSAAPAYGTPSYSPPTYGATYVPPGSTTTEEPTLAEPSHDSPYAPPVVPTQATSPEDRP